MDLTQPEAERQENLPGQKASWSVDTEDQMRESLVQIGIIISTFQMRILKIKRVKFAQDHMASRTYNNLK